jgi:very-short-patch-repair endonuclease
MMSREPQSRGTLGVPPPPERGRVGVGVNDQRMGGRRGSRFNRTAIKTEHARKLRVDATGVERRLWQELRGAQIDGASFRRQHPAGRYILDFYCPALQLAIELDGGQHAQNKTQDRERDEWLAQRGVAVLRFWNSDITQNLSGVIELIALKVSELKSRAPVSNRRWRRGARE